MDDDICPAKDHQTSHKHSHILFFVYLSIDRFHRTVKISSHFDRYVGTGGWYNSLSRMEVDENTGWNYVFILHRLLGSSDCF